MTLYLNGTIFADEAGTPAAGVWVRLTAGKSKAPELVRTGWDGAFRLPRPGKGKATIEVTTRAGNVIAWHAAPARGKAAEIVLQPEVRGEFPVRRGAAGPILREDIFHSIGLAVDRADPAVRANAHQALQVLRCALPPIAEMADILDLADGVLEGRTGAVAGFRDRLSVFAMWNAAHHAQKSAPDANMLTSLFDGRQGEIAQPHSHQLDRDRVVESDAISVLLIAAVLASGDDHSRVWHSVQAIFGQVFSLAPLRLMRRQARDVSFDRGQSIGMFLETLGGLTGFCPPGFDPLPGPGGSPIPFPDPGAWHDPVGLPPVNEDCIEIVDIVAAAAAARGIRFTVTSIEPANACPGQTITIEGSGFSPAGQEPSVGFDIEDSRAKLFVPAETATDDTITVVVPDGATCGELEINIPVTEQVVACGQVFDILATPTGPIPFQGGRTRIENFVRRDSGCVQPGGEIEIAWQTCNVSALELTIESTERPPASGTAGTGSGSVEIINLDPAGESQIITVPALPRAGSLLLTLDATGPCGRDQRQLRIGIQRPASSALSPYPPVRDFRNWHGNVSRPVIGRNRPRSLDDLVDAVRTAERLNMRVGVEGTRWSYTDCIAPRRTTPLFIDTGRLNRELSGVLPDALADPVRSILSDQARQKIDRPDDLQDDGGPVAPPLPIADRLVHVEAGIKLWDLNCQLDERDIPLAVPNLGGSRGQSLAGAINTGTHGATVDLPPIPDLVRAIHLVANGGQQWWIERASNPVTHPDAMRDLMARGALDPCLELHYDDALFNACLVSMGHAGIVYAYVIETVPQHNLREVTRRTSWTEARAEIQRTVLDDPASNPWYLEISVNPSSGRPAWITTRTPTSLPATSARAAPDSTLSDAIWAALFGTAAAGLGVGGLIGLGAGAVGFVIGGISLYFARRSAEIARIILSPWEWGRIGEIQQELDLIDQLIQTVTDLTDALGAQVSGDPAVADESLAKALPNLINAFWRIGFYVLSGRQILDTVQNLFTNIDQRPPGTTIDKSFTIFTEQTDCAPQTHSAIERLIQSQEYGVPADLLIPFAEDVLDAADQVREAEDDALILIVNLRFVRRTDASLGVQQFPVTGLVEIWTVDGIEGNRSFHDRVNDIANGYNALPHWGHVHQVQDLRSRFPRHREWQRQLDRIARHTGNPNTFRHQFALDRNLLSEL